MYTTPLYGTGFEMGSRPVTSTDYSGTANVSVAQVHTGTYSLVTQSTRNNVGWMRFAVTGTPTQLYVSVWCRPDVYDSDTGVRLRARLDTGHYVDIARFSSYVWKVIVNGSTVATGSIATTENGWQQLQIWFDIQDSGHVTTKIDGVTDIEYSGDTMPGATGNITHIYLYQDCVSGLTSWTGTSYWDDFSFGTGDWGGDIRFDVLTPTSDDTAEWTPSTGSDNYAVVDEIPPNATDYVYADTAALDDKYGMSDWNDTAKTPYFLVAWALAKKDTAGTRQLNLGIDSNGSEDMMGNTDLTTTYTYYYHIVDDDPDISGEWTDSAIDAALLVIRSN